MEKDWKNKLCSYDKAVQYILDIPKFTSKNNLEITRHFYEELGKISKKTQIIHVAGTNGKGSVCTYLDAILREHGYTTGRFTSPHLITMRERFRMDDKLICENDFFSCFRKVMETLERCGEQEEFAGYHPTFFEMLFFIGMEWYKVKKPDFLILETGLGGRLDATNIIENPRLCIITKIGMDHMAYLGDTISQIAMEKAGIIKEGVPIIYLYSDKESAYVMENEAIRHNARADVVRNSEITKVKIHQKYIDFYTFYGYDSWRDELHNDMGSRSKRKYTLPTLATYQVQNAALAICAARELLGRQMIYKKVYESLFHTTWEGRMEEVLPSFFVDGAHNEDGINAFLDTLTAVKEKNAILLFAVNKDKEYRSMIQKLANSPCLQTIIVTSLQNPRSAIGSRIGELFTECTAKPIYVKKNVAEAVSFALSIKKARTVYAAGSLYLVGEIKKLVEEELL